MEKYMLVNYRTRSFSQKTFEGQSDFFVVADVVSANEKEKVLEVVPIWNNAYLEMVQLAHMTGEPIPKLFKDSFYGEFSYYPNEKPLYRKYTHEDAYRGLCDNNSIGNFVHNLDGSIRVFNSIIVFCIFNPKYVKAINDKSFISIANNLPKYLPNWDPGTIARHKKRYCYVEI